jgi:adenylate cyclase
VLAHVFQGRPWLAPYAAQEFLPTVRGAAAMVTMLWLLTIVAGLVVRQRWPSSRWIVQGTLFQWYAGTVFMIYCFGTATSPVGVQMVGGALVGVLLFDLRTMAPVLIGASVALVTIIVAERMEWVPYAPLLAKAPYVQGQVATPWFMVVVGLFVAISICVFIIGATAIVRWRRREAEVTELTEFLQRTFGRYLSPAVMRALIANPESVELGGRRQQVTILLADIRGFTQLSERLQPEQVVALLNRYLREMTDICERYQGTVTDIVGDEILLTFGAPQPMTDHAKAAVACSIEMQNKMDEINAANVADALPELEIGIGLNTAEVVIGNIGSERRSKFSVVGSGVNMTSRIESYSVGGQILASQSLVDAASSDLRIDGRRKVMPKGSETPITIYEIGGVGGCYGLELKNVDERLQMPTRELVLSYALLAGKQVGSQCGVARVRRLSRRGVELEAEGPLGDGVDLKFNLTDASGQLSRLDFYGKAVNREDGQPARVHVRFTSLPPEIAAYLDAMVGR